MNRGVYLRIATLVAVGVAGWFMLWPSLPGKFAAPSWVADRVAFRISPGLDIRGGLRMMYQVEVDTYVRDLRNRKADEMLRQLGLRLGVLTDDEVDAPSSEKIARLRQRVRVLRRGDRSIEVQFTQAADTARLTNQWLRDRFPDFRRVSVAGNSVTLTFRDERVDEMRDSAVAQAASTISERIDALGVREATVSHREDDVIVEVPGASEAQFESMRGIIARTARLEFKIADESGTDWIPEGAELPEGITRLEETVSDGPQNPNVTSEFLTARGADGDQKLRDYVATLTLPDDRVVLIGEQDDGSNREVPRDQKVYRTYLLVSTTAVTGEDVDVAQTAFDQDQMNQPYVLVRFKPEGADEFGSLTTANVKRRMAIVLDDIVQSAPSINEPITGGVCRITLGGGSNVRIQREADELVVVLRSGALPAPIRPSNEQLIGPTLGRDAVQMGAYGAMMGIGIVLLFMLVYYEFSGLVASIMVLFNLVLQMALMAFFEATLTLPGIAAVALTVGMAVDANVLITERIRDELRLGKSARSAVDQGFDRAFWSIVDSQLTTMIAAVVLFQFGTGPIKGFSVLLMIGIVTSLFTGIFGSRVLMDFAVRVLGWERLRVG